MPLIPKKINDVSALYSDFYPVIFSAVYNFLNNVDETKDICQEVFLRYMENYESVENPRKWLYAVARNATFEHCRRQGKTDISIDDIFEDKGLGYVNGFRDTRIIIQNAIDDMNNYENEKDKILFDLVALHNFTYKEAEKKLGMTERQVKYRYGLVVDRLVRYFNKKGIKSLEDLL